MNKFKNLTATLKPSYATCLNFIFLAGIVLSGCTGIPYDYPKQHSTAIAPDSDVKAVAALNKWSEKNQNLSGVLPLIEGIDALGARLRVIESAQVSIDAQYFLMKPDITGGLFQAALLQAADRGVRVRLLLDDIFTSVPDKELALMNAHPNLELRLFNPISRSGWKSWNMMWNFAAYNRRMHNKALIVDNVLAITGGRNIAEEYFQIQESVDFLDFDLFAAGPVTLDLSATFDEYWNSELAVPVEAFLKEFNEADTEQWRNDVDDNYIDALTTVYAKATSTPYLQRVKDDPNALIPTTIEVVSDSPSKLSTKVGEQSEQILVSRLVEQMNEAKKEVLIITPYFVPRKDGVKYIKSLIEKGLRVIVITNSLTSTNHTAVHSGYARYRKELLQAGVELYELQAYSEDDSSESKAATLHTKFMIFDQQTIFVGSINIDPRSIELNSEMGLFIDTPKFAEAAANDIKKAIQTGAYRVNLDTNGKLYWQIADEIVHKEPQSTWWQRFSVGFYKMLPIEGQL